MKLTIGCRVHHTGVFQPCLKIREAITDQPVASVESRAGSGVSPLSQSTWGSGEELRSLLLIKQNDIFLFNQSKHLLGRAGLPVTFEGSVRLEQGNSGNENQLI